MDAKRLSYHLLFWLVYFMVNLYNELYLSKTFLEAPTWLLLGQGSMSILLLLLPKLLVVYLLLYVLLPKWLAQKNNLKLLVSAILLVLLGALTLRLLTQKVIWPYVYAEVPAALTAFSLVARYLYSTLDLLQVVGVATSIKLYKLHLLEVDKAKRIWLLKSRAELMNLKAQTNPHFLFNTLNSIYAQARAKSDQTAESIMQLSKILRYTIYDTNKEMVLITDELKIIEAYIGLQQQRFGDRIKVNVDVELDDPHATITPLLLLPLVENIYKHCNNDYTNANMSIHLAQAILKVQTTNPSSSEPTQAAGTGLQNIERQLGLLFRDFSLQYGTTDGIFQLNLTIHLKSYVGNELFNS